MKEKIYIVKRGDWEKTYTSLKGATKALNANPNNELFEYVLNTKEDNPRVSKLIEPIKEQVGDTIGIPLTKPSDFKTGDKLFYELGYYTDMDYDGNWFGWTRTGKYKEIENPEDYLSREDRFKQKGFVEHHNFRIQRNL